MHKFSAALAAAILTGTVTGATALPKSAIPTAVNETGGLLQKTHGWHRHCDWGPIRFHRHVPGYGNVPCAERRAPSIDFRYRRPPLPDYDGYRRRPPARYCDSVFYECKDEWGGRTRGFYRCMRHSGCE